MATNPMQRKARNSFLLGMLVMLLISGIIIGLLFMQLMNKMKKEQEDKANSVTAYVLNQDVKAGQTVTDDMLTKQTVNKALVPTNATSNLSVINNYALKDKEGNALYPTCDDVWGREDQLGHHVIMVGGSETCMETAIYLLRAGHKVTMLTRQKEVAHDASKLHYITWVFVYHNPDGTHRAGAEWEKYPEFTGITEAVTIAVDGNTVKYLDREGQEHSVSGDSVVLYGGRKKHTEEALTYAGAADQFLLIGDCTGTGNIQACSRQAFAAAAAL